jgi:hypothetical protein
VTENIIPDDQANGVVDGTLSASEVPASLRGAAEVLAAAHQPATSEELAGMMAMVSGFTAAVVVPAQDSPEPVRSTSRMLTSRITTRAAVMASVGLLVAGTAAAAAGGAIPSPFHAARAHIAIAADVSTTAAGDTTTTAAGGPTTTEAGEPTSAEAGETNTTEAGEPTTVAGEPTTTVAGAVPGDGRHHGLCEAWSHDNHKQPNPALSSLDSDAKATGKTVGRFCNDVISQWNHRHGHDPVSSTTTTTTATGESTTTTTEPQHPQGPPSTLPHPKGPPVTLPHQGPPVSVPPISVPSPGGHGPGHGGLGHGGPVTTTTAAATPG